MENLYEQVFFLKLEGNWTFTEVYTLPVKLREWFVKRLMKHHKDKSEAQEQAMKKGRRPIK
jgi:hypothetical protein